MAKYFKMLVSTEILGEIIVKADSIEDVKRNENAILDDFDPLYDADIIRMETEINERPDYDDDDVQLDLTKGELK